MNNDTDFVKGQIPTVAGLLGAVAVRWAIKKLYMSRRGVEPPVDPGTPESDWRQAILWTMVIAAGAGAGRLVARYVAGEELDKRLGGQRRLKTA